MVETLYASVSRYRPGLTKTESRHDFWEIAYILGGRGFYFLEGHKQEVATGDLILMPPQTRHQEHGGEGGVDILFVAFLLKNPELLGGMKARVIRACPISTTHALHGVLREIKYDDPFNKEMIAALVTSLVVYLGRELRRGASVAKDPLDHFIDDSVAYLKKNFSQGIRLKDLCGRYRLNENYFSSAFKRKVGSPPIKFLHALRIEMAKRLLLHGNERMGEIARIVGYEDPLYFSRIFKKTTGLSPKDFRKLAAPEN